MEKEFPFYDFYFDLEKALVKDGFRIEEREKYGYYLAYGFYYELYGEIFIEFCQYCVTNFPFDMVVYHYPKDGQTHGIFDREVLYQGVAPTNQHDYDLLMLLLFPSKEFENHLESCRLDWCLLSDAWDSITKK